MKNHRNLGANLVFARWKQSRQCGSSRAIAPTFRCLTLTSLQRPIWRPTDLVVLISYLIISVGKRAEQYK